MHAKALILGMLVIATMVSYSASLNGFDYLMQYTIRKENAKRDVVDDECRYPEWNKKIYVNADCLHYKLKPALGIFAKEWPIVAWYYEPKKGSCQPLYSKHGHNACYVNSRLSKTKEMCTFLCGIPPCVGKQFDVDDIAEMCDPTSDYYKNKTSTT